MSWFLSRTLRGTNGFAASALPSRLRVVATENETHQVRVSSERIVEWVISDPAGKGVAHDPVAQAMQVNDPSKYRVGIEPDGVFNRRFDADRLTSRG
jgi:hypothetical protein